MRILSTVLLIATSTLFAENSPTPAGQPASIRELAGKQGFKPYEGNPVLSKGGPGEWDAGALGSMTVIKVGDTYHMYYEAWGVRTEKSWDGAEYNSLQIGHATSKDGIHWVKDPANPVIAKGKERDETDAWDRDGTWDPFVIYEDGVFKMWYGGGNRFCDWGYAVSTDGTHFTKKGRISNLGKVEDDHVFHDKEAGRYYMYYWDRAHEPLALFRATSPNETDFDFKNAQQIKIEGEVFPKYKFSHVFKDNGVWYMLYGDFKRPHCPESTVRLATSPDGLNWTKVNGNLVEGHDGEMLKLDNDLYAMFYGPRNHFDAANCDIRLALFQGNLKDLVSQPPAVPTPNNHPPQNPNQK